MDEIVMEEFKEEIVEVAMEKFKEEMGMDEVLKDRFLGRDGRSCNGEVQ